jgi:hypothetical protein
MRVIGWSKWQLWCCVASHMGRCQPGQATTHQQARTINAQGSSVQAFVRSASSELMKTQTFLGKVARTQMTLNAPPGQTIMAIHKRVVLPHYAQRHEQGLRAPEHTLAAWRISAEVQVRVLGMSGERRGPRGRGGSRGRPPTQRRATPPASSEDDPWVHGSHLQRSISRQISQEPRDCGHSEHPAIKYRIPCTLENNTLIVSVTVEHCSDARRPRDGLTVPRVDMEVPKVDFRHPPQTKEASTSTMQPARTPKGGIQPATEEDNKEPRPVTEDEPYETDEE